MELKEEAGESKGKQGHGGGETEASKSATSLYKLCVCVCVRFARAAASYVLYLTDTWPPLRVRAPPPPLRCLLLQLWFEVISHTCFSPFLPLFHSLTLTLFV